MLPTGEEEEYPFQGLFGCTQTLELVGMGTQLVVDAAAFELVVDGLADDGLADEVAAAGQVQTDVEYVAVGFEGPGGGFLEVHPPLLQFPPGQKFPQYCEIDVHQLANWKQFKLSGKPA